MKKTGKKMKKMLLATMISTLFVITILSTNSVVASSEKEIEPLPNGSGLLQRIRNQIRDMLGTCQGDCELVEITGILAFEDPNFYVDEIEVHFGPNWYITSAESAVDYDDDGEKEIIYDELMGLVGEEVTFEGHMQSDGWMSVFTINGEIYREPGQPIWASQHQWRWRKGPGPN